MYKKDSSYHPTRIVRWVLSFVVLAVLFFILPASCDQMPAPDGGGDSGDTGDTGGDRSVLCFAGEEDIADADPSDVDDDDDGLIEIYNLDMFHNIRYNLAGTSYDDEEADSGSGDAGVDAGCPVAGCNGYELMANLDFSNSASYASGSVNSDWCPNTSNNCIGISSQVGFPGIGVASGNSGGFNATFEGNDRTIANLYSRMTIASEYRGLFNSTDSGAHIRNLGITNANIYGEDGMPNRVGSLVGLNRGTITAICATGSVEGGGGDNRVGGLAGENVGTITAGYASVNADGGGGGENYVGGLVGYNNSGGTIRAGYATGSINGGDGNSDRVGGLVGFNEAGTITASYATASVNGGVGVGGDSVGGLTGENVGTITASYATGSVNGGDGSDFVGGLVGFDNNGTITASYATSSVNGGGGSTQVSSLVGLDESGSTINESYGFGTTTGGRTGGDAGTAYPSGVSSANGLATGNAGSTWNDASNNTAGAWNFGTASQNPALVYNDYDGAGTTFASCTSDNGGYPTTIPGTTITITCEITLVGGSTAQGR